MPPEAPEQKARRQIDANLTAAGWIVQSRDELDLTAGRGIAVREFRMASGFGIADYLLYVDRKAIGVVEAKADGTLTGVEAQSAKYSAGLPTNLPAHRRPLPFMFQSNGQVTFFTNALDPTPRSRQLFNFPQPETLASWCAHDAQLRGRLQHLPELDEGRLWGVQSRAIHNLEASLGRNDPRALVQMATGSGKTFTAVNIAYRLLKYGKANRILFLVDRDNLAKQADDEFRNFEPPDDTRKFPDLFAVQRLRTNAINPASKVVITTIQRLWSMLRGDTEFDAENEAGSAFDTARPWQGEPPEAEYNPALPPEFFDFVIVDECHRSIYELWSQVLLYFDAFTIGLTATPAGKTFGFFNQNLVMQYGHAEAVADGVNVDFDVYRIRTRVTEHGAVVAAGDSGVYVDMRHRLTRAERLELMKADLTYTANQLDRDVVSESQIRTVLQQFREKVVPDAFPDREELPKTLIFAKDDSHADDIVRLAREVFAAGDEFCQKITYRTGHTKVTKTVKNDDGTETEATDWVKTSTLTPDDILSNFRNSFYPRIAVTVDMIATGTDVKPIECVFFMRNVKSAGFFEQMKGRGVRVITPDKLRTVSRSATTKDRFIIVDAVGVCEQDKTDSHTLNRRPAATLQELLNYVAAGGTDPEALTTLASRLSRLQRGFSGPQLAELQDLAAGRSLGDLSNALLNACEPDAGGDEARNAAIAPFSKPAFRNRLLEIRKQTEQVIDRHTVDEALSTGLDAAALDKARAQVDDFRQWIRVHKDELTALQVIYSGVRPLRVSRQDLRQLRDSLERPPISATPVQLWRAFEAVDVQQARERSGTTRAGEPLADLVQLVRHAIAPEWQLEPYANQVRMNYVLWMHDKEREGVAFLPEQREWLDRMAEHIAMSLEIQVDDFEDGWFGQQGSLGRAHALFGRQLNGLLRELNERLAA